MFSRKNVLLDIKSTAKADALGELVEHLKKNEVLDEVLAKELSQAIMSREKLGSTGIGNGVAVPHAKVASLSEPIVAIGRSVEGLDYQSIDGEPVYAVFFVACPPGESELHLSLLKWYSKLSRNSDFRMFFRRAKNVREVQALLREMGDE
jgi:mannitol/fructose-specific phosphotransferase system IIA component (Ntr-type)